MNALKVARIQEEWQNRTLPIKDLLLINSSNSNCHQLKDQELSLLKK
jgi:hypothetical protein